MLLTAGLLDLGFALFHAAFWRLFGWPASLEASGRLNTAITQTLNAMLIFVFLAYGAALIWQSGQASVHPLLPLAGAGFWSLRLVLQFVWFDLRPWPSKLIAAVFALAAVVHLLAAQG
ncbi:hypothetical protein FQV39_18530 [Bosea sp. F3-2]|uniref:hypothetical protein n=1 Tax=Bosea sp. F3-2 TaxID=2599640 RepID=UPI0011EE4E3E|nr:hypothetical protein [Bosea sp. F3-2]QEL24356.1 hypothetical protein FQV39_18530 [Bosea sp. F3-2]